MRTLRQRINRITAERRVLEAQMRKLDVQLASTVTELSLAKKGSMVHFGGEEDSPFAVPMSPTSINARLTPEAVTNALASQWEKVAARKQERETRGDHGCHGVGQPPQQEVEVTARTSTPLPLAPTPSITIARESKTRLYPHCTAFGQTMTNHEAVGGTPRMTTTTTATTTTTMIEPPTADLRLMKSNMTVPRRDLTGRAWNHAPALSASLMGATTMHGEVAATSRVDKCTRMLSSSWDGARTPTSPTTTSNTLLHLMGSARGHSASHDLLVGMGSSAMLGAPGLGGRTDAEPPSRAEDLLLWRRKTRRTWRAVWQERLSGETRRHE